jgi:hypothetical protein
MNKKYALLTPLIAFILYTTLTSSSGGINGQSVLGCTCHGVASANTLVSITGLPAGGYIAGTVYPITISVTNTTLVPSTLGLRDGFGLTATAGAFTAIAGTALNGALEIRHSTPKAPVSGTASWTFNWTAPSTGNANVSFFLSGNATNGSGDNTGDNWNQTNTTIVKNGAPLSVTTSNTAITCNGNSSTITATGSGGALPYQYQRNAGTFQTSNSFSANVAGTYTITVKDATAATASTVVTITQPSVITPSATNTSILCNGGTASITASGTGGTGAYNYRLNAGAFQTTATFTGLTAATYTVTVRDANLCTKSVLRTISAAPSLISFNAPSLSQPLCNGMATGSITISAVGGTGTKTYSINPLGPQTNTTGIFSNLSAQVYTITATDANLCTRTITATLGQPTAITWSTPTITNPICVGGTGSIQVSASGGTGTKTYTINPSGPSANTTGLFSSLTPQTYSVTVTDINNCVNTTTCTITPAAGFTTSAIVNSSPCTGGTTSITASATSSALPIIYQWYSTAPGSANLLASKDNTIFESMTTNSNGAGPYFTCGRTNQSGGPKTRALLSFNLSSISANAIVTQAELTLNCSQTAGGTGPQNHSLYTMQSDWGEGSSNTSQAGVGATATTNDATWFYGKYATLLWSTPGGDFLSSNATTTSVDQVGPYTWSSTNMNSQIQQWINNPASNFGWMLKSAETTFPDSKRYDSREGTNPPVLHVDYLMPSSLSTGSTLTNASAGTYYVVATDANGCTSSTIVTVTEVPCNSTLQLTTFLQGYYMGSSFMTPVMTNQGVANVASDDVDDITVNAYSPSNTIVPVASITTRLKTNGSAYCVFPALNGNYYIEIRHRNSISTWSADPILLSSVPANYNLSNAATQAFGGNLIEVEPGVFAVYSGDINQDGFIDSFDFPLYDTDSFNGVSGTYVNTDLNGDGFVDSFDFPIFDVNSFNGVSVLMP